MYFSRTDNEVEASCGEPVAKRSSVESSFRALAESNEVNNNDE
jgi:hypothetical protein